MTIKPTEEVWIKAVKVAETVLRNLPDDYGDITIEVRTIAEAIMAEREACARVAAGDVYLERYRTWPWWKMPDGCGNRANESELVRHADEIADAIRNRP